MVLLVWVDLVAGSHPLVFTYPYAFHPQALLLQWRRHKQMTVTWIYANDGSWDGQSAGLQVNINNQQISPSKHYNIHRSFFILLGSKRNDTVQGVKELLWTVPIGGVVNHIRVEKRAMLFLGLSRQEEDKDLEIGTQASIQSMFIYFKKLWQYANIY